LQIIINNIADEQLAPDAVRELQREQIKEAEATRRPNSASPIRRVRNPRSHLEGFHL
jgi:hypothetical protein